MTTFTTPPDGRVRRCPYCRNPTVTTFRCSNFGCERDLAGVHLETIRRTWTP